MKSKPDIALEDTRLYSLYTYEIWWLAHSIKEKTDRLFSETTLPESGYLIQVKPELHTLIASILSDAAAIKRYMHTPSSKAKDESGRQFRLRKSRSSMLNELVSGLGISEILDSKVRNTLEHFDEYLDESNIELTESSDPNLVMAAYNMILSHWEAVSPRVYPIRLDVSVERKFYNMKWSVDLGKMNVEAGAIIERIRQREGYSMEEPAALMLRLR